jgi:hypothetical protein
MRGEYPSSCMKRLLRIVLNAATLVSLVLVVAVLSLWVRGAWYFDRYVVSRPGHVCSVDMYASQISFRRTDDEMLGRTWSGRFSYPREKAIAVRRLLSLPRRGPAVIDHSWDLPGFFFREEHTTWGMFPTTVEIEIDFSYWLLLVVGTPLPLWWLWLRRRLARRSYAGRCRTCGYDLRATPDRCPECGTVPTGQEASLPGPGE